MSSEIRAQSLIAASCWDALDGAFFAVIGLGLSGVAAANALARLGADVLAYDDQGPDALTGALARLDRRVQTRLGSGYIARPGEIVVVSPGLSVHSPTYRRIAASAAGVVGEVELFARLDRAARGGRGHPVIAVTGTDGKTTTTMLIDHLLRSAGHKTLCAGNIGEPLCNHVGRLSDDTIVVAEVSEFQLATTQTFAPAVLVLTNVADDHLDWFGGDRQAYVASMVDVAARAGVGDHLIVNAHDPAFDPLWQTAVGAARGPSISLFSARRSYGQLSEMLRAAAKPHDPGDGAAMDSVGVDGVGVDGVGVDGVGARGAVDSVGALGGVFADRVFAVDDGCLVARVDAETSYAIVPTDVLGAEAGQPMLGVHNHDNALAAAAAVLAFGLPLGAVQRGLRTFKLPPHRLEPVGTVAGVRFINDSKATNPHAAIHGLRAIIPVPGERLVWIGGGSDKDAEFDTLAVMVRDRADLAVLIGATAERIAVALRGAGFAADRIILADDMHAAVARAFEACDGAAVVLLSPACASFGLFRGYQHRGEVFTEAVALLAKAVASRPIPVPANRDGDAHSG